MTTSKYWVSLRGNEKVLELGNGAGEQFCKYTKNHCTLEGESNSM